MHIYVYVQCCWCFCTGFHLYHLCTRQALYFPYQGKPTKFYTLIWKMGIILHMATSMPRKNFKKQFNLFSFCRLSTYLTLLINNSLSFLAYLSIYLYIYTSIYTSIYQLCVRDPGLPEPVHRDHHHRHHLRPRELRRRGAQVHRRRLQEGKGSH